MRNFYLCLAVISLLTTNCNKYNKNEGETIVFNLDNIEDINHKITKIDTLALDDNKGALIGAIQKILLLNQTIYILDASKNNSLFVYDNQGCMKFQINYIGNGEGEFISITDFDVDEKTGNISILDSHKNQILTYDNSGKFLYKIPLTFFTLCLAVDSKTGLIIADKGNGVYDESKKHIALLDSKTGEVKKHLLNIREEYENYTIAPLASLRKLGDTLRYLPSMNNSLYSIINQEIIKRYNFDFGNHWPDKAFIVKNQNTHPVDMDKLLSEGNYIRFLNFLESENILHLNFTYKDEFIMAFHNKKSGITHSFKDPNKIIANPMAIYDNSIVFVKYPNEASQDTNQNPILLFVQLDV